MKVYDLHTTSETNIFGVHKTSLNFYCHLKVIWRNDKALNYIVWDAWESNAVYTFVAQ